MLQETVGLLSPLPALGLLWHSRSDSPGRASAYWTPRTAVPSLREEDDDFDHTEEEGEQEEELEEEEEWEEDEDEEEDWDEDEEEEDEI